MFGALVLSLGVYAAGSDVINLESFPQTDDEAINDCYEQSKAATARGKATCVEQRYGDYWVCPAARGLRLSSLKQCQEAAIRARDQAAMSYLLGLIHQDFRLQDVSPCPDFFEFQEGADVCIYTNYHFKRLIASFPDSHYSEMAAVRIAQDAYRYYECEGSAICDVENRICGWIDFLKERPQSEFADLAVDEISEALHYLSEATFLPRGEYPDHLLQDLEDLRLACERLSPSNAQKLSASVTTASEVLVRQNPTDH